MRLRTFTHSQSNQKEILPNEQQQQIDKKNTYVIRNISEQRCNAKKWRAWEETTRHTRTSRNKSKKNCGSSKNQVHLRTAKQNIKSVLYLGDNGDLIFCKI